MKKFRFPLERVRNWREAEFEREQQRLAALLDSLANVEASLARLLSDVRGEREALAARRSIGGAEFAALEAYLRYCRTRERELVEERTRAEQAVASQRAAVVRARQRFEALDRYKQKQLANWRNELSKEEEQMVAELVIARWNRSPGVA